MATFPTIEALKPLVGQEAGASEWFEITQPLINSFAQVTQDRQWIHCDPERACRESPYAATVAHGFFTLALLSHFHGQAVEILGGYQRIINYGLNRVRYPAPVIAGSRLRAHSRLQVLDEIPDGWQLSWLINVEIEGTAKPALVAEWLLRYYR